MFGDIRQGGSDLGIFDLIFGYSIGILFEFFGNFLGIFWEFFGNFMGILWEFFGNYLRILWEFEINMIFEFERDLVLLSRFCLKEERRRARNLDP